MPGLDKGVSTQHTNQQFSAKPRHQPLERDQQMRERLRQKAKIKSRAYIQLGEQVLQTVHQTFEPNIPVILHLPALANTTIDTDTVPLLYVIQEGINCMSITDYFFTSIKPEPIVFTRHTTHHSKPTAQQAATQDPVSQQTHPLWPGKTRVYPSMLADKQVPMLNPPNPVLPPKQIYKTHFNLFVCVHMAEKKGQKIKMQSDYLSDSESSEDKVNPLLCTSQEERVYGTIKGSTQATQAVLSHSTTQCNPTVERGPPKQTKIKELSKEQASDKTMQTKEKKKPL